jgi:hypothetical protein
MEVYDESITSSEHPSSKYDLNKMRKKMCNRRYQRVEVQDIVAALSNGVNSFSGTVINISRLGMLLKDVPQKFRNQGQKLSITVSAKGKTFIMQVESKWISGNAMGGKMGVAILDPPVGWTLFAMICEPKDGDIWATKKYLPIF